MNPRLLRLRIGQIETFTSPNQPPFESAIRKLPVEGPLTLGPLGLQGDHQQDPRFHGGPDKAILCYPRAHYVAWARESTELGEPLIPEGTLGENFEVDGLDETTVCLGDIYALGPHRLQVSQPRQPCWKPARLHHIPQLTARILRTGRTGWYLRVLSPNPAPIAAPAPILLEHRPNPTWSVARASHVRHFSKQPAELAELAALPELSAAWREDLAKLL